MATDNVWIVKPTHLSKGAGIQCFRDLPELLSHAKAQDFKVVAQRYVAKPLVIHNKKVLLHQAVSWFVVCASLPSDCVILHIAG